jgi:hypothetical protein
MYPQYATGYEEIVGRRPADPRDMVSGVAMVPYGYATGQALPPPPPPAPPPHMAAPPPAAPHMHGHHPHPMAGPHHPGVHLAHPYHPMFGWRGGPGAQPVVFAGYPGGGVAYGGAPAVVERPLRDIREYPLGFFQSGIGVCTGAIDVISRPQIVFRGERLVIPSGLTAASFSLIDVKVGNRSQLANSTAVPAQTFTETAVGVRLALDTATVAMDIALVVENITSDNQTFQAALIGTAAQ